MMVAVNTIIRVASLVPWGRIIDYCINKLEGRKKKMRMKADKTDRKPWLDIARDEVGVKEIRGRRNEERVLEYHAATRLHATEDSVPWCASFVSWCLEQSGFPSTRSARARSYMHWGDEIDEPELGCIVVFWRKSRESRSGHVAFYIGDNDDGTISVLGGNQSDQVKISRYDKDRILSYRMPEKERES